MTALYRHLGSTSLMLTVLCLLPDALAAQLSSSSQQPVLALTVAPVNQPSERSAPVASVAPLGRDSLGWITVVDCNANGTVTLFELAASAGADVSSISRPRPLGTASAEQVHQTPAGHQGDILFAELEQRARRMFYQGELPSVTSNIVELRF